LKNYEPIARKCYSYILSHLSEDISMRNCALNCHISYEYLSRTIKKNFHSSYSALVHQLRIKRACVYLHSDKSIADIAEAVGYKSSSQFCHAFSKIKGMSPNKWKKLR
jgi:two-component system, response regulator YesN